ncbi:SDR family NAD(P)-dependent oxidoreductase [Subtercola boreus]|uniref:Short-chain dehydrogenase n=1 Tax=Subtercola boreus TaxID=120213 RepID=A0A3E0WAQ6_9MICO|nr:SDR family NAD(P)-dependent oxidoreductase [Subtercola boreus]RFA19858.1 short-chain dehydrogenase [Subtercola boreus]RFA19925.1 short-chain dehydrogenase [Subtercola boreus]RFA26318.1 short-chain dehydrogenase [Subtercola boreus]
MADSPLSVVLVTGTSTGIGLHTAVAAALAGWQVVATVRREGSDVDLRAAVNDAGVGEHVEVRMLDITDPAAVTALVADVVAAHGHLDAVVNNAGQGHIGTVEQDDLGAIRQVMETNYFGVVNVTKAAMPHLRASAGRLVTVTSVGGVVGQPFSESYCAAKFAVEGMMESLHPVAAAVGVRVTVVEPGAVATSFVANVGDSIRLFAGDAGVYRPALESYLARSSGAFENAQLPQGVAEVIVGVLQDAQPPFRVQSSQSATAFVGMKLGDLDGSVVTGATTAWIA